jgi:hypothetical protein
MSETHVPLKSDSQDALSSLMREILEDGPDGVAKIEAAFQRAAELAAWNGPRLRLITAESSDFRQPEPA